MSKLNKILGLPRASDDKPGIGNGWLEEYIPYQLYRLAHRLDRRLQARLRKLTIKPSPWRVMTVLRSNGTLTISHIAEHSLMEQPTVSRVIAQLETDGLIERKISVEDSRVTLVTLTPAGIEMIDAMVEVALRHQQEAFSGLTSAELSQFRAIVAKIQLNIDFHS